MPLTRKTDKTVKLFWGISQSMLFLFAKNHLNTTKTDFLKNSYFLG